VTRDPWPKDRSTHWDRIAHACLGAARGETPETTTPMRYNWTLNEVSSAGRENLDPAHAAEYDRKENADANAEVERLIQLGLSRTSVVVDFGAGTGQFTLAAAPVSARVVAVDVSPVMLAILRNAVHEAGVENVDIVQSGFLTYEHQGHPADFLYSRFALHHLPDFWKSIALQRLRRITRRGGVLRLWDVVYNFAPEDAESRLEAWCATLTYDESEGGWTRADIEEHVRDEHSTFTWLLEPMMERSGFHIEDAEYSPDGIFARYVARAV
jgi:ubiquinone/menaquinone biosynthesis C-methylase UbiE